MPAQHPEKLTFDTDPNDRPLTEPIVRRGAVATFRSQADRDWGRDADFLGNLALEKCYYGAAPSPLYPFVCEPAGASCRPTAGDVLRAVKARHFRSQHIASLGARYIPFPGYHPGTENDEIHNDFKDQFVFSHEDGVAETDAGGPFRRRQYGDLSGRQSIAVAPVARYSLVEAPGRHPAARGAG
jgi:hypothetical protein